MFEIPSQLVAAAIQFAVRAAPIAHRNRRSIRGLCSLVFEPLYQRLATGVVRRRAVEIDQPGSRLLTISGTASIEPGGETVHLDDTKKQIELTMEVVHEILKSRNMDWEDTARAIAYFKDDSEAYMLEEYCIENNLPELPVAISHADVCRHDLLFEIELDAVKAN